jgi:phosphate transport system protein
MPGHHSSKQYDLDLEAIRSKVLRMGGIVQDQLNDALTSFKNGDLILADFAIKADHNVNQLEVALDEACSHLIVKRQPAANDLRNVTATLKVITDLERIGDEASKIARLSKNLHQREAACVLAHYDPLRVMATNATAMLHDCLDVYARFDDKQALRIITQDETVNYEYRAAMRTIITYMMENPRAISSALDVLWVAKAIERIGDHAKSISEHVIFIVEGKDIRHTDRGFPKNDQSA